MASVREATVLLTLCLVLADNLMPSEAQSNSKCLLPKDPGACSGTEQYYYFDSGSKSCKLADFTSCPGNLNYFKHKSVCELTCAQYFGEGHAKCLEPKEIGSCFGTQGLYYFDQATKSCQYDTFSSCPGGRNHFKYQSVCQTVCAPLHEKKLDSPKCLLPKDLGTCEGDTTAYYYFDMNAKACKLDHFTTCPGNLNYFRFKSTCEKTCAPYYVKGAPKCLNQMDPGDCEGSQELFYFDQDTKTCIAGNFTDCPGNLNHFQFKEVCDRTCAKHMEEPVKEISTKRSVKCLLEKDEGSCTGSRDLYYFDNSIKACRLGTFTKCPGNKNYFKYKAVCESTCAPYYTKASKKCLQPMDAGNCEGSKEMYYFDMDSRTCKLGTFTSCPGNLNYFRKQSVCESTCGPLML